MELLKLLGKTEYELLHTAKELKDIEINAIVYDSRKIVRDSVFICIKGPKRDGHNYIEDVCQKGAAVIITEKDVHVSNDVTHIQVKDARLALAELSAAYFDYPAEKMKTIGITGTKGKTMTSVMVRSMLECSGIKTGLIGTNEVIIGDRIIPANNTTPESYILQEYLADMVLAGCECVVMEVSSQGLMMNRTAGILFDYGVFTNIEPDHIAPDEHKDFDDYLTCKAKLFKQCRVGIMNKDDRHLEEILKGHTCDVETFGLDDQADLYAENIELTNEAGKMGIAFDVKGKYAFHNVVNVPGKFTVYNALTAISICSHFGVSVDVMKKAFLNVKIKGRVETVDISDRYTLMIDYAHNAMSLESLLTTLLDYKPTRLICMFGCGGDRSRDRRFEMGEISSKYADLTVVTSDNPRTEEPEAIIEDILTGVKKADGAYIAITDRKSAIRYCISNAKAGDLIVLAGKGHETYQEIHGVKNHMDERELIAEILEDLK